MNEFLFWFLRPLAEALGVFFMLVVFVLLYGAVVYTRLWWIERKKKSKV